MVERKRSPRDNPRQASMILSRPVVDPETDASLVGDEAPDRASVSGQGRSDDRNRAPDSAEATETHGAEIETLVQRYHDRVYRYAYWLSGCSATAEDIAQETFLRAMRGLHGLRDERAAESWLLTITRHEFLRWKGKQRIPTIGDGFEVESTSAAPEVALADAEWVRVGLDRLADEFRVVVLMYYFENLSYAEIANRLEIPMGTVMSRLSRGKHHLKNALLTERTESGPRAGRSEPSGTTAGRDMP